MSKIQFHLASTAFTALILLLSTSFLFSQKPGFFLDDWEERTAEIPDYEITAKPSEAYSVTVHVDMDSVLKKVPQYIFGNNAVTYDNGLPKNATAMADLNNLNPHVLRWPGGNLSCNYFWNAKPGQRPDDIPDDISPWYGMNTASWQMSLDEYYALRKKTNSNGSICVNYSYARYGLSADPVAKAAHLAADWVRYDNGRTKFWELGNENFGSWETGYEINTATNQDDQPRIISGELYGQHCLVFIDSMRAAAAGIGANIKIGVVAYDAETSWDAVQTVWNEGMMPLVGQVADFLIVHSYFTPYDQNSTVSTILNSHNVPNKIMSDMVSDMEEAGQPMIPVAMTEWNIFAVGSMQAVSYINGMHAALVLGECIANDYGMSNRWNLVNGWDNGNDHAMFSSGGEPGVDAYNPRPAFFYMYYFQKYFGDRMVLSNVEGNNQVIAYASSFSSGDCGVVLVNKSRVDQIVELDIENFIPGELYYTHTLTGGTDNGDFSRKVYLNGQGTDEEGGGPDHYKDIKALASEIEGGVKVELPALGVVYLMAEKISLKYEASKVESDPLVLDVSLAREVDSVGDPSGFVVVANQTDTLAIDTVLIDAIDARILHVKLNQPVLITDLLKLTYSGQAVIAFDGEVLDSFMAEPVDNLLPGSPPFIKEASTNMAGTEVHLVFSKRMTDASEYTTSFLVRVDGAIMDIAEIHTSGKGMALVLDGSVSFGEEVQLSYLDTTITSEDRGVLTTFTGYPVTNDLAEPFTHQIPGTIDAERFMTNFGMQLETCSDIGGGQNLGYIDQGDWVDYQVDVTWAGKYKGFIRTAAESSSGRLKIQCPDAPVVELQTVTIPVTGGWQTWTSVPVSISLEKGIQTLRLYAATANFNINWLSLEPDTATGFEQISMVNIQVYPNPASDRITIEDGGQGFTWIAIVDMTGRTVVTREFDMPSTRETLDLHVSRGIYLVKVKTAEGLSVSRIVVN